MKKPNLGILVKPAGSECNMACEYCYYRVGEELYPDVEKPRMTAETFDAVCRQYRALEPRHINIGWQGGEPTLMGLDFYRKAVEIETKNARPGDCWGNSLQTNGVLLDDEWCRFLHANHFLVGLSVDGPRELNSMRRFPGGKPAFDVAMRALSLLKQYRVEYNVLVVISRANVEQPEEVFRFLVENDLRFCQFMPCTEPGGGPGGVSEHSITAGEYADFMIALFDAWVENDDPSCYVRRIDNWLHLFFDLRPECCEYRNDCSNLITIEWNGDVYPCDFYVYDRYHMGNVRDRTLSRMIQGRAFRRFVSRAEQTPPGCRGCEWLRYCHGGCFRHREKLGIGPQGQPYLCEANKRIFGHVFGRLGEIMEGPEPPALHSFMNRTRRRVESGQVGAGEQRPAPPSPRRPRGGRSAAGRNDPCPCGSGRKFKHCCGRKAGVGRVR